MYEDGVDTVRRGHVFFSWCVLFLKARFDGKWGCMQGRRVFLVPGTRWYLTPPDYLKVIERPSRGGVPLLSAARVFADAPFQFIPECKYQALPLDGIWRARAFKMKSPYLLLMYDKRTNDTKNLILQKHQKMTFVLLSDWSKHKVALWVF